MNYVDTQNLSHYSIKALDGELGHVSDFYFDEDWFYLRYLLIDTEPFLSKNLVLVSPISFNKVDVKNKIIEISMTKKELEDSPSFESVETVSRKYEKAYNDHFSWPYYWGSLSSAWAIRPYGIQGRYGSSIGAGAVNAGPRDTLLEDADRCGLRSSKEVCTYSVEGTNHKFGHIQGFILNPKNFSIDFLIIDTINYLPSKNVLLRPEWLEKISWESKSVKFPFTKELIKSAPAYSGGKLSEELIEKMDQHFQPVLNEQIRKNKSIVKDSPLQRKSDIDENDSESKALTSDKEAVVGHIPSGLFVVTVENKVNGEYEGFLASWVQQASFDPLLVSLCIKDGRPGIETVLKKSPFCINIVGSNSTEYLSHFIKKNKRGTNPLKNVPHHIVAGKGVFINGAKSVIVCKAHEISHPGDHYLVTAEVTDGFILNSNASSKTYLRDEGSHY